jgi:hypothetical protein
LSKGEKIDKQQKYFKENVDINAKGGECWTQWYDISIDVNRVHVIRSNLRINNVVGHAESRAYTEVNADRQISWRKFGSVLNHWIKKEIEIFGTLELHHFSDYWKQVRNHEIPEVVNSHRHSNQRKSR